jgi:NADH-dependant formate dehydrogenase delta subunit FdsD
MHAEYLIRMANDIASFFSAAPARSVYEAAAGDVSLHGDTDGHYRDLASNIERAEATTDPATLAAAAEVASHIRRFWDPRMRSQIIEIWRAGGGGLSPVAKAAVGVLAG